MRWTVMGLALVVGAVSGCEKPAQEGVKIKAPGVDINISKDGTTVKAPGTEVKADKEGVDVEAPGTDVKIDK